MNTIINKEIQQLFSIFYENHYQLYLVGGCVRDFILKRDIHDIDLTTDATPTQMEALAKAYNIHYLPTGIAHGTVTLILNHQHFEITTFRKEGNYHDHRRPEKVFFSTSLKEDLKRRDFTINALCMDEDHIIDYYEGTKDIQAKIIRCVGDPLKRFEEDALRIMRCLRLAMELQFRIEANTYEALKQKAHLLKHIANERIRDELIKMLMSDYPDMLLLLKDSGILDVILPEYTKVYHVTQETPYHIYDVFHHMNAALNAATHTTLPIKLALLLHDLEKWRFKTIDEYGIAHFKQHAHASAVLSKQILKRLKFDNKTIQNVYLYIDYHDYYLSTSLKVIRRFLYKLHGDFTLAYAIMDVQKYDNLGKNPTIIKTKNEVIDAAVSIMKQMEAKKECFHIKDLAINGNDLIALGYQGKEIKLALEHLLLHILNQQEKNNTVYLIHYAGGHKDEIINH